MVKIVSNRNAVPGWHLSKRLAVLTDKPIGGGVAFWKGKNEDSNK